VVSQGSERSLMTMSTSGNALSKMVPIVTMRLVLHRFGVYMKEDVGPVGCQLVWAPCSLSTPYGW